MFKLILAIARRSSGTAYFVDSSTLMVFIRTTFVLILSWVARAGQGA